MDGSELGERKVERLDYRWATWGRHVLAWSQNQPTEPLQLRLYDAWTGRDLWHEQMPAETSGTLIDCDEVAWVQPDGRLTIRSLRDDRVRLTGSLPKPEQKLATIHVLRGREHYIVATNQTEPKADGQANIHIQFGHMVGMDVMLLTGQVQAFDRGTGQALWKTPVAIDNSGSRWIRLPNRPCCCSSATSVRRASRRAIARRPPCSAWTGGTDGRCWRRATCPRSCWPTTWWPTGGSRPCRSGCRARATRSG